MKLLILNYYKNLPEEDQNDEIREVINYLKQNPVSLFPYKFKDKYKPDQIEIKMDKDLGLFYTIYDGKRMYYKNEINKKKAQKYFHSVILEQDPKSPHRYLTDDFNVDSDMVVADIGVAEGIFTLSIIDKASKVYLFEPDEQWQSALKATFRPWSEKVEIVPKMVSDISTYDNITLDDFFKQKNTPDFLKIDVDGLETAVLRGARNMIGKKNGLKVAVCTYHYQKDAENFQNFFENAGYATSFSRGYMIYRVETRKPYLRRGVLRAQKL